MSQASSVQPSAKTLTLRLYIAFGGLAVVFLIVISLAFYLTDQLSRAIERTTEETIPLTRTALGLAERGATIVAAVPALASAASLEQLDAENAGMDGLFAQIDAALLYLERASAGINLVDIRTNVDHLQSMRKQVNALTLQKIELLSAQQQQLREIRATHNVFLDTISPVVYGVSSINRLFGKRLAREFDRDLKTVLRNNPSAQDLDSLRERSRTAVTTYMDQTAQEMGAVLDIKAEGNLLFALLTATAETERIDALTNLLERFRRSNQLFGEATQSFLQSALAQRNPILASNLSRIQNQVNDFESAKDNLFSLRQRLLSNQREMDQLLAVNPQVAGRLATQVEQLLDSLEQQTDVLHKVIVQQRDTNNALLITGGLLGLILMALITMATLRRMKRDERRLRLATTILQSTNEGILVTDQNSKIVFINPAFTRITGYSNEEAAGQTPRILQSGRHTQAFYEALWHELSQTGHWQGEMFNKRKNGDIYPEWLTISAVRDDEGSVTHYAAVFSDISVIKKSQEELDHLAHHDPLTGLPNRLLLHDRLSKAMHHAARSKTKLAILFIDLDRFKNINDTLGHSIGDRLLSETGLRLQSHTRDEDTVSRLGGDEFLIILEELRHPDDAGLVAGTLLKALAEPFEIDEHTMVLTASIGISLFPDDGADVETLVRNADTAMYRAKELGKNNYQFYSAEFTAQVLERFALEKHIRDALHLGQFELYYQPQISLADKSIVGVEALLRWHHPKEGVVAPPIFLHVVEEIGMMSPLGDWVFRTACRQWREWVDSGIRPIRVAVNVSGSQFSDRGMIANTRAAMDEFKVDPNYFEFEITESTVLQSPDRAVDLLNELRDMGIRLAIDDFGTGYSSLSYLKRLPIHALKIDRSFISDIPEDSDDAAITLVIIALAHTLRLEVVAEGVENGDQEQFLHEQNCDLAQGYFYSRPIPADKLTELLRTQSAVAH